MLYYKFQNYKEFKELFGLNYHSNGTKSRKNKILLSFIKDRKLLHKAVKRGNYELLHISSMQELKYTMMRKIKLSGRKSKKLTKVLRLNGDTYFSAKFSTDEFQGICEDGDYRAVRYINHENNNRIFKMKAGKFFRAIVTETRFGKTLCEQVFNWLSEEFAADWQTYTMNRLPQNTLYVNEEFERIYSSEHLEGDFSSCMVNRKLHIFYADSVKAKAAYLENSDGKVIARCIIFTEARDQEGNIYRLAERQYSSNGNEIFKRALVDALIKGGHIDGYKQIGACCGDSRSFVDINGNSLMDRKFEIECTLDYGDKLSYQDSFKWLDIDTQIATNYGIGDINLATTAGHIYEEGEEDGEENYDSYHEVYTTNDIVRVFYRGDEFTCDEDRLDDFIWIEEEDAYFHYEDVTECTCGIQFVTDEGYYSEELDRYFCCKHCMEKALREYEEVHEENNFLTEKQPA